jgi:transcriptional regulator with XRE-family HTH domain
MATQEPAHHHGLTIRAYRTRRGLTQAQLAERWPGGPVNPQYVQRVETGKKRITDQETLRRLGELLGIPLWHFGLSEYDPFHPHNLPGAGTRMYAETLDAAEYLLQQAWSLRTAALTTHAEQCTGRLGALFEHFQREMPPPARLEARFLRLSAQLRRLQAVCAVERRDYAAAIALYGKMHALARQLDEAGTLAMAVMSLGSELSRAGRAAEAVDALERARDLSFAASKPIAAFVLTYLGRVYAAAGDMPRFERTLAAARAVGDALGDAYGDGGEFIYARQSSILAELSWGWLELGRPRETLALRAEIARQIAADGDRRLATWIPLDWARAHLMLGEPEAAVAEARAFAEGATAMGSPHARRQVRSFLRAVEAAGYGGVADLD